MEAGLHLVHARHPAVARHERVEGSEQGRGGPAGGGDEADAQPDGVDPGVGPSRRVGDGRLPEEAREHALELGLDGTAGGLALPSDKPGTVEVQRGEECPAHRPGI